MYYYVDNLITRNQIESAARVQLHGKHTDILTCVYKRVPMANMCIHAGSQQYDMLACFIEPQRLAHGFMAADKAEFIDTVLFSQSTHSAST